MEHEPMTRSEEIRIQARKYYSSAATHRDESLRFRAFIAGARWADAHPDRTMVERAICFIEDAVCEGAIETGNMARLIENFKEAMGVKN